MNQNHKEEILRIAEELCRENPGNYISEEDALRPEIAGMRIFENPIMAVASADDPLFDDMRSPQAVGEHFMLPKQWDPSAVSVISYFLPFTDAVKNSNIDELFTPSAQWLHGRYEGQFFNDTLAKVIRDYCLANGFTAIVPTQNERFLFNANERKNDFPRFSSNWSERHVAYVCGLGTFGLTRHLITEKGCAGRFSSIVTSMPLAPNQRPYSRYDEYCTYCADCISRCPVNSITCNGKILDICVTHLDSIRDAHKPRYGCGKCAVAISCQSCIPSA